MFEQVLVEFAALVGFAAFVSLFVNALKVAGVVKDGTADKWVAGINMIGVLALVAVRLFVPDFDIIPVDNALKEIAVIGSYILGYVTMLLGSKITYVATKGLPLIGKSNSTDEAKG